MSNRFFLLPVFLFALAAYAAGDKGDGDKSEETNDLPSAEAQTDNAQTETLKLVSAEDFRQLQAQVEALKEAVGEGEDTDESGSGMGFGGMLLALICGAVGGGLTTYVLNFRAKAGSDENENARPDQDGHPTVPQTQTRTNQPQQQQSRQQQQQPCPQQQQPRPQRQQSQPQQQRSQPQQQQTVNMHDEVFIDSESQQERYGQTAVRTIQMNKRPATQASPTENIRIAYGDLMIPSAGLIIIEDGDFNDSPSGGPFRFDINESHDTATYTFAPQALPSVMSNLSRFEPFVMPFEYDRSARGVAVTQPGTLRHMDGYWQVMKRITISFY